jgi:trehalose 6-phosphate phosphatase
MMEVAVVSELFGDFLAAPSEAGIFTDFDGTLSPIVDVPDEAQPLDDVAEVLGALAERYGRVAVVSGRPVSFLEGKVPSSVVLSGLHGLERLEQGQRLDHPQGGVWREVTDDIAVLAVDRLPPTVRVEAKGISVTLHYREHPEVAEEVHRFAEQQAARSGLVCRQARMSYELHPPVEADKGTAVIDLTSGLQAACFIGDDRGDLAAFAALDGLAATGMNTVKVAVASREAPAELIDNADLVLPGPAEAVELLRWLSSPS